MEMLRALLKVVAVSVIAELVMSLFIAGFLTFRVFGGFLAIGLGSLALGTYVAPIVLDEVSRVTLNLRAKSFYICYSTIGAAVVFSVLSVVTVAPKFLETSGLDNPVAMFATGLFVTASLSNLVRW